MSITIEERDESVGWLESGSIGLRVEGNEGTLGRSESAWPWAASQVTKHDTKAKTQPGAELAHPDHSKAMNQTPRGVVRIGTPKTLNARQAVNTIKAKKIKEDETHCHTTAVR